MMGGGSTTAQNGEASMYYVKNYEFKIYDYAAKNLGFILYFTKNNFVLKIVNIF